MTLKTPLTQGRFLPGSMIAGRWRVVALLGRGGMGEVYRADDLKLGEAVALKFLPERLELDGALHARFVDEARLARQVAHPNVCRVYDIGEADGRPFLSMEYVDGEDLGTLLRRIGRLPRDKAVQIAREMCAGLAAAHAQGILHRDLKPSNVMLDGRGHARLTDFGLAVVGDALAESDAYAGTPAFMAPEQLNGKAASVASDVYALGLVLYEMFTGKPAYESTDFAELAYLKQNTTPSTPSSLTPDVDPVTERAILRCLATDPSQRPSSAAALAAALPGGDPLAAALAAGETPSPEMVAEGAGDRAASRRRVAVLVTTFAISLAGLFALAPSRQLLQLAPLRKPPAVLVDRARTVVRELGYGTPADDYSRLLYFPSGAAGLLRTLKARDVAAADWSEFALVFGLFHRSSPDPMVPRSPFQWSPLFDDPPLRTPGMTAFSLDATGRVVAFEGVPPRLADPESSAVEPDWPRISATLQLLGDSLRAVTPLVTPPQAFDRRVAWVGTVGPARDSTAIRIEAAAFHGRLVWLGVYPGTAFDQLRKRTTRTGADLVVPIVIGWFTALFAGLVTWAAFRHRRRAQADERGALRVALAGGVGWLASGLLVAHRGGGWLAVPSVAAQVWILAPLAIVTLFGLYLALEPVLRRTWPQTMVSWMRLVDGRWRDPLVNSDVLFGLAAGTAAMLAGYLVQMVWSRLGGQALLPGVLDSPADQTDTLMGGGWPWSQVLGAISGALGCVLVGGAGLAVTTQLTRQRWLGLFVAGVALTSSIADIGSLGPPQAFDLVVGILRVALVLAILVRMGLVPAAAFLLATRLLRIFPLAAPGSSWYWPVTAVGMGFLVVLVVFSARMALGEKPRELPSTPVR